MVTLYFRRLTMMNDDHRNYRHRQRHRCLAFEGSEYSSSIQEALEVEHSEGRLSTFQQSRQGEYGWSFSFRFLLLPPMSQLYPHGTKNLCSIKYFATAHRQT